MGFWAAASDRSIFNSNYSAESRLKMQSNALNYMLNLIDFLLLLFSNNIDFDPHLTILNK